MYDYSIVDYVDAAFDRRRTCSACGAPNLVRSDEERLFVVCSKSADRSQTVLRRIAALLVPHDRVLILS